MFCFALCVFLPFIHVCMFFLQVSVMYPHDHWVPSVSCFLFTIVCFDPMFWLLFCLATSIFFLLSVYAILLITHLLNVLKWTWILDYLLSCALKTSTPSPRDSLYSMFYSLFDIQGYLTTMFINYLHFLFFPVNIVSTPIRHNIKFTSKHKEKNVDWNGIQTPPTAKELYRNTKILNKQITF